MGVEPGVGVPPVSPVPPLDPPPVPPLEPPPVPPDPQDPVIERVAMGLLPAPFPVQNESAAVELSVRAHLTTRVEVPSTPQESAGSVQSPAFQL